MSVDTHTTRSPAPLAHAGRPGVSVVIVNFQSASVVPECIRYVLRSGLDRSLEILLVDNSPGDGCVEAVRAEFPEVRILSPGENVGYGRGNNLGFEAARGDYVVVLNPDAFVAGDAIQRAIAFLEAHTEAGVVGGQLVGLDGTCHPSARMYPTVLDRLFVLSGLAARYPRSRLFGRVDNTWWDHSAPRVVDWVIGAFMVMRAADIRAIGGFDPRFFLYFEEWDLCRRLRDRGLPAWFLPDVRIRHIAGVSSQEMDVAHRSAGQLALWNRFSQALYYRKHRGLLGVASMFAADAGWLGLWWLRNRLSRDPERRKRAEEIASRLADIRLALHVTRWGRVSPPQPWRLGREAYSERGAWKAALPPETSR
jgi:hypothetical protein